MEKHQAIGPKERLKHQVNGAMGLHCTCTYVQAMIRVVPELYFARVGPSDQIPEWDHSIHFGANQAHYNTVFQQIVLPSVLHRSAIKCETGIFISPDI